MRICILTHTFPRFEGDFAAPFMSGLAQGMAEAGNEVYVLTPFTPGLKTDSFKGFKVVTYKYIFPDSLHKLGYSQTLSNDMKVKPIMYLLSPLMGIFGFFALLRLIYFKKIEVINAHWILPNGFIGAAAAFLTGRKLVCTLPGSDVYMARKNVIFKLMTRFAAFCSSAITSNSPELLSDLEKIGIKNKRFETIIYGVNPDKFKPDKSKTDNLRKKFGIKKNKLVILAVGRLVAKKGFSYLLKAIPEVVKRYKSIVFLIIGEGDQRKELEEIAKKLKIEDYLKMPGWVDYNNLATCYNSGDIFILPSIRDEKGNLDDQSVAVVEAMACSKPVIATAHPGYKIVIENGKNGFLIKEKDELEIADAVNKLIKNSRLRLEMGGKSRQAVLSKFSWEKIGKQYTELFKSLH